MLEGKADDASRGLSWSLESNGSLTPDAVGEVWGTLVRRVLDHHAIPSRISEVEITRQQSTMSPRNRVFWQVH